ncbi:MAG: hypothetical protein U9O78_00865 [Patescibacteria group bacterium]|nr:hypothetical protein [Patescibacteria group bacterium]
MNKYLFLLGNTPKLSILELETLLQKKTKLWRKNVAAVELEDDEQAKQLMELLGGTFKVCRIINNLPSNPKDLTSLNKAYEKIADKVSSLSEKPTFALSGLGQMSDYFSAQELKKVLRKKKISCRYRKAGQWGASASILTHEKDTLDLIVIEDEDQIYLTKTVAIQEVDEWVNRDRNKPYSSGKKGMLPPKLARIMVNLALGNMKKKVEQPVLYDPFSGTGTILIEALLRGCQVVGSDIDHDAVAGSLENLYWLEHQYQRQFKYQIFQADVAQADERKWETKVDSIVTEPFLGRPNPKKTNLKNIFKGLKRMYLGSFKTWASMLKPGALVVIIFPFVQTSNFEYNLLDLIDKLTEYGYTLEVSPQEYYRKWADVKRHILIFRYQE